MANNKIIGRHSNKVIHLVLLVLILLRSEATSANRIEFRKHFIEGGDSRDEFLTEVERQTMVNDKVEFLKSRIEDLDSDKGIRISPTERARQRGMQVTNSRDSFAALPVEPFSFILSPVNQESSSMDGETLRPSIEKALSEHFTQASYSDSFISFDSLELAEITILEIPPPQNNRALFENNGGAVAVSIEGGKANFNMLLFSPSAKEISSIAKDCVESDSFLQTIRDIEQFSSVEQLQFIQGQYEPATPDEPVEPDEPVAPVEPVEPDETVAPVEPVGPDELVVPNDPPSDPEPNDGKKSVPSQQIGVLQQQVSSAKAEKPSSSSPSSTMLVAGISVAAVVVTLASAFFLIKKRRSNEKEWSTEKHDPNNNPFNLASMDSQQLYNTGVVSLGEKSNLDDDFLYHNSSRKNTQHSQRTKYQQNTSEQSISEYSGDISLRDNILEMTRSIFINFSAGTGTKNNHSINNNSTTRNNSMEVLEEKDDITSESSTQETSTYDLESQDNSSLSYIPDLDRPPPISIRMTSASSSAFNDETASEKFDLEPDMSWDPNDNDVDSDAASIDAPFVLT